MKMHFNPRYLLVTSVYAAGFLVQQDTRPVSWKSLSPAWLEKSFLGKDRSEFTIPAEDGFSSLRALEIERKRQGYLYGPSLLGNTSYFPTGAMGDAMVEQHINEWLHDASWVSGVVEEEAESVAAVLQMVGGMTRLN